jgi:sodium pump decarboxylase gamma subunit
MMINTALAMSFGDRTAYAGKVFLIGIATVFAALIVLWLVLALFRKFVAYFNGEDLEVETKAQAPAPVAAPVPVAQAASDDALIAVITAAVAAALAEENGGAVPGFRVVSFQKISTVSYRK